MQNVLDSVSSDASRGVSDVGFSRSVELYLY
jgi:hypothetical protein